MSEERCLGFDGKEMGLLCYHHMVASRFLDERHTIHRHLGMTTPEMDQKHIEAKEVCLSISDKLEKFMEHAGIGELLSEQVSKLFVPAEEIDKIYKFIKEMEDGKPV